MLKPQSPPRRGVHLVEFALVVPIFLTFVIGAVDVGRGFMVSSLLTNAAHAGCRVAVLPGKATSDTTTAVDTALHSLGISGYSTSVKVNGAAKDASTAVAGDVILVTVAVPVSEISWLPGAGYLAGSITGQYALVRE
jgi:Flp pilus assembly protein TadG